MLIRMISSVRAPLAMLLASGVFFMVSAPVAAQDAAASGFSKAYIKAASPLQAQYDRIKADPAVQADKQRVDTATTEAARSAAQASLTSRTSGLIASLTKVNGVTETLLDKAKHGQMLYEMGVLANDPAARYLGLVNLIESGKLQGETARQSEFQVGINAYQAGMYAAAVPWLRKAYESGFVDQSEGSFMLPMIFIDALRRSGNEADALKFARLETNRAISEGSRPSEHILRVGLQSAYNLKDLENVAELGLTMARYSPSPDSWHDAIGTYRQVAELEKSRDLDLLRLMEATKSFETRDQYLSYVEDLDARAYPVKALGIVRAGLASKQLTAADVPGLDELKSRADADRAALPGIEAEARSAAASASTLVNAGDLFLTYDEPVKAEAFYIRALRKPGIDANQATLRLGMAQVLQGKYPAARANLGKVTGDLRLIAKFWSVYADVRPMM